MEAFACDLVRFGDIGEGKRVGVVYDLLHDAYLALADDAGEHLVLDASVAADSC